jgi:SpoVK/Ycf46/Vps4 family AAA+-type ATPase
MKIAHEIVLAVAQIAARRQDKELLMLLRRRIRPLEEDEPELAQALSQAIASAGGLGAMRKFRRLAESPVDPDSGLQLLESIPEPQTDIIPVLDPNSKKTVDDFLRQRRHASELRQAGIRPPSTIALLGPPGTGKTTLAHWIAAELGLPLFVLNLVSAVTSYLGQTGQNLKKALDEAKSQSCVFLIDEFDSLGRTRADSGDVMEMQRVVTALLQELDRWPDHSVLIAATNLPELVDFAFRRRFDRWLRLLLPGEKERLSILQAHCRAVKVPTKYLELAAIGLSQASGADLALFVRRVASRQVLDRLPPLEALWAELQEVIPESEIPEEDKRLFVQKARALDPKRFTYRNIAPILGISHTTAMNFCRVNPKS